jgi:hypothetical protein
MRQRRLLQPAVTPHQTKRLTHHILLGLPAYLLATLLAFWNPYVSLGLCSCLWIFWAFTFYEGNPRSRRLTAGQDTETTPESEV